VHPTKKSGTKRLQAKTAKKTETEAAAGRPIAAEPSRVGKRGTVVIPAALRRQHGIEEGTFVVVESREGGVLIRPAVILPVETYTAERKAQFLLSNAVDAADYAGAVAAVQAMGLDPNAIPHYKPPGA
jgi:AbrB family looped-hinge helix DNA binding protein